MHFSLMGADERVFLIQMYISSSLFLQFLHSPLGTKLGTIDVGCLLSNTKGAVSTLKIVR